MIRKAQFAGTWYPAEPTALRADLTGYLGRTSRKPERVCGVIAPHAGFMYSGPVAGAVYARVEVPEVVVVLSVNHRGIGAPAAIMARGFWETPLGRVPVEEDFARRLLRNSPRLEDDDRAHLKEHSLEMQLPFLQVRNPGFRLVPICLQRLTYPACRELGSALAQSIRETTGQVLLVASTDMTHFESQDTARSQDMSAIRRIQEMDPEGLYQTVQDKRISMCGVIPTTALLCAAGELGAREGELVRYATSGDVSGDLASVVGYAGILLR